MALICVLANIGFFLFMLLIYKLLNEEGPL